MTHHPVLATQGQSAPLDSNAWISLSTLATEGFGSPRFGADTLEARQSNLRRELAEHVRLDDVGIAHIPRQIAREMFTQRNQEKAEAQARQAARAAERAAEGNPLHERLKAIHARQERLRTAGLIDDNLPALALMTAGEHQARMEAKGRHLDEMMRSGRDGTLTMHRFDRGED